MPAADRQKWDAKYSSADSVPRETSAVLVALAEYLPCQGTALELAGGAGRNAIWLAARGLDVTIWDVSPVGLALAHQRAAEAGQSLTTRVVDLELGDSWPPQSFSVILSVCYLFRPVLARIADHLRPGGTLVIIQPTLQNLERHQKPPRDFLLAAGELPGLVKGVEILHFAEGWNADGRHDAVLVARKPAFSVV